MKIRFIAEVEEAALHTLEGDEGARRDRLVDLLIEAFNTPDVDVLDIVDEDDSHAWLRSRHF